jgi:tetratricopeptide (TPR) repeat protein
MQSDELLVSILFFVALGFGVLTVFVIELMQRRRASEKKDEDPEALYQQAMRLFHDKQFREAYALLESAARLNPNSAPLHFTLATTCIRISSEYGKNEELARRPWAEKSYHAYRKAISLSKSFGGLDANQLQKATDAADAMARFFMELTSEQFVQAVRIAILSGHPLISDPVVNDHERQVKCVTCGNKTTCFDVKRVPALDGTLTLLCPKCHAIWSVITVTSR